MNKNPDNSSWVDGAKLKAQTPFVYLYIYKLSLVNDKGKTIHQQEETLK